MISRKELASEAYRIIKEDFGGEISSSKIWQAIAETDAISLLLFVTDKESRLAAKDTLAN